jgi:hypothetical protein
LYGNGKLARQLFRSRQWLADAAVAQRIVDWRPDKSLRKRIEELGRNADEARYRPRKMPSTATTATKVT